MQPENRTPKRRRNWRASFLLLLVCSGGLAAMGGHADSRGLALEELLSTSAVWSNSPSSFMKAYQEHGFRWVSEQNVTARAYKSSQTLFGAAAIETLARFEDERLIELDVFLFNRGDSGEMAEKDLKAMIGATDAAITKWAGSRPTAVPVRHRTGGVNRRQYVWTHPPHQLMLEYSYSTGSHAVSGSRVRPEYLHVRCIPFESSADLSSALMQRRTQRVNALSTADLKQNVRKEDNGDTYVDGIPMVDQGPKGYCAVAVSERVLRYYGREVNNHELAQLAMTSGAQGTSPDAMITTLRKMGKKLSFDIDIHDDFSMSRFRRMISKYNTLARRDRKAGISLDGLSIALSEVYQAMDVDLLREARLQMKSDYKGFLEETRARVDEGLPLCWTVIVGKISETPPINGLGGHLRLIIGYNDETQEILYSDTWGRGHELKRMAMDDAWAITTALYTIEPKKLR